MSSGIALHVDQNLTSDLFAFSNFREMLQILFLMVYYIHAADFIFTVPIASAGSLSDRIQSGHRTDHACEAYIDTGFN
ncbi:hypothetical protein D3C73_1373090 [compost metagenome]